MRLPGDWRTAALMAGALVVGTVIGPAAVQAASAGVVRIEGGGSSDLARCPAPGRFPSTRA
jgi:hypothetical protein